MESVFPNAYIIYKAVITLSTSSASAERSSSQVQLIKTRIRSTMGEDRLEHLLLIRCEGDVELSDTAIKEAIDDPSASSSQFASKLSLRLSNSICTLKNFKSIKSILVHKERKKYIYIFEFLIFMF